MVLRGCCTCVGVQQSPLLCLLLVVNCRPRYACCLRCASAQFLLRYALLQLRSAAATSDCVAFAAASGDTSIEIMLAEEHPDVLGSMDFGSDVDSVCSLL